MEDSRYREIMEGLGMPNSRSLLSALQQVANEVAQQVHSDYEKNNKQMQTEARNCPMFAERGSCCAHKSKQGLCEWPR